MLGNGEQTGDIVTGVRVVGGEIGIVHVEPAHGDAIGQSCPFAVEGTIVGGAVVDKTIADHLERIGIGLGVSGGHLRDFPGKLLSSGEYGTVSVGLDQVVGHGLLP